MDLRTKLAQHVERSLLEGTRLDVFPSGVSGIRIGDEQPVVCSAGVERSALFDVASLTKVVATLPAVLLAIQAGKAGLHDPVIRWLPEFASRDDARREHVTLYHLLTHTSGLPAWRPFFVKLNGRGEYAAAICREPLIGAPGAQIVYSDPGFMLLGFILERIWDAELEQVISSHIIKPLGLSSTGYKPGRAGRHIAPTEKGNAFEKNMAYDYIEKLQNGELPAGAFAIGKADVESFGWREETICGTVHDCNAFYGLNGVSGHAGLFSDIDDLFRYMDIWRSGSGEFISEQLRSAAIRPRESSDTSSRGLGWECYGEHVFGHTGFTGTSLWHHTEYRLTCIALTNRVHPAARTGIQQWRGQLRESLLSSFTS
ncbi:serine hydrolase domain-containing protein [Gordoniibacillus kamchatkensis]|uniref:serine hydrolase domain-containing protein n=1 Tax=Gordoniibacillus kamchatkensis TaxID=1590651 RepID=UPI000695DDBA|nr:serine hydrolase [Paenibacillus sp. VKM B-2647]